MIEVVELMILANQVNHKKFSNGEILHSVGMLRMCIQYIH